jgi:hypothetical protein
MILLREQWMKDAVIIIGVVRSSQRTNSSKRKEPWRGPCSLKVGELEIWWHEPQTGGVGGPTE